MMDTTIEQMRPDAGGRNWLVLGGYALASFSAAGLGALVNKEAIDGWYRTLAKPSWNPPDEVFAPVWTALYAAMALAAWLVWQRKQHEPARGALTLWWIQLLLNLAWSIAFFGLESPAGGLVTITMLWLALAATTVGFFRVRRLPGWLMVPYLAWVSFASALNFAIWRLN